MSRHMCDFYESTPVFDKIGRTVSADEINADYSVRFQTPDGLPHLSPEKIYISDANDSSVYRGIDSLSTLFVFICQRESISNLHLRTDIHLIPDPNPNPFLENFYEEADRNADPDDPNDVIYFEKLSSINRENLYKNPDFLEACNMQPVIDSINKSIAHITCDNNDAAIYVSLSGPNPAILISSRNITDVNFMQKGNPIALLYLYSTTSFGNDKMPINVSNSTFIVPLTYYNIVKALLDLSFGCMNHRLSNVPMIHPFVR